MVRPAEGTMDPFPSRMRFGEGVITQCLRVASASDTQDREAPESSWAITGSQCLFLP